MIQSSSITIKPYIKHRRRSAIALLQIMLNQAMGGFSGRNEL